MRGIPVESLLILGSFLGLMNGNLHLLSQENHSPSKFPTGRDSIFFSVNSSLCSFYKRYMCSVGYVNLLVYGRVLVVS